MLPQSHPRLFAVDWSRFTSREAFLSKTAEVHRLDPNSAEGYNHHVSSYYYVSTDWVTRSLTAQSCSKTTAGNLTAGPASTAGRLTPRSLTTKQCTAEVCKAVLSIGLSDNLQRSRRWSSPHGAGSNALAAFPIHPRNLKDYVSSRQAWHNKAITSPGCKEAKDHLVDVEQHAFMLILLKVLSTKGESMLMPSTQIEKIRKFLDKYEAFFPEKAQEVLDQVRLGGSDRDYVGAVETYALAAHNLVTPVNIWRIPYPRGHTAVFASPTRLVIPGTATEPLLRTPCLESLFLEGKTNKQQEETTCLSQVGKGFSFVNTKDLFLPRSIRIADLEA